MNVETFCAQLWRDEPRVSCADATQRTTAEVSFSSRYIYPSCSLPIPHHSNANTDCDPTPRALSVPTAAYSYVTLESPNVFTNLLQIYDEGFKRVKPRHLPGAAQVHEPPRLGVVARGRCASPSTDIDGPDADARRLWHVFTRSSVRLTAHLRAC